MGGANSNTCFFNASLAQPTGSPRKSLRVVVLLSESFGHGRGFPFHSLHRSQAAGPSNPEESQQES